MMDFRIPTDEDIFRLTERLETMCPECIGTGNLEFADFSTMPVTPCKACNGTGKRASK